MRPTRVVGSALGVLVFAACVTPAGGPTSSRYETSAAPLAQPQSSVRSFQQFRDSVYAQAVADREGPRVSVRVEMQNVAGSRRARAMFHLDDDAYVVIGQIAADGVVRIVFPTDPSDDGFARGQSSYRTSEFFAGFVDEYRYRASTGLLHYTAATPDSYDGGLGYVFVIASWRPMHFDQFSTNGVWDTFELASADYMNDPRPAIYELASLLSGDNREAYTVKFARYTNTTGTFAGSSAYNSFASSAFGSGYCNGYAPLGFAMTPFDGPLSGYSYLASNGGNFYYRGTQYLYNIAGDCYTTYRGGGYAYPWSSIAQAPPAQPKTPRTFDIDGHRTPPTPTPLPGYKLPVPGTSSSGGAPGAPDVPARVSPHYRDRGLITADDPTNAPERRSPRIDARTGQQGSRPSIEQMINRRDGNANDANGGGWSRAQSNGSSRGAASGASDGWSRAQSGRSNGGTGGSSGASNPERQFSPEGRSPASQPRSEPARVAPSPPAPSPRAAPSSPPPAAPSPPPPSSSSSSSGSSTAGGTPIKP